MNSLDSLYSSHPVDGRSIRVFQVEAIGAQDDTRTLPPAIKGRLKVVNLDTRPKFSALSYVWGTSSVPPNQVLCNGRLINVTTSCWAALLQLIRNFGALTIWIDAICINQRDDREKERQIPLMRDVYALAGAAYVWLGEGDSDTDEAMDYLSIAGFQPRLAPNGTILFYYPASSKILWSMAWKMTMKNLSYMRARMRHEPLGFGKFFEVYLSCIFSMPDSRIRSPALEALFSRPWASRVWTLQEVVLASNPIVCCGSKVLSWRSMIYSMAYFEHSARNFTTRLPEESIRVWKRMVLLWCFVHPEFYGHHTSPESTTLKGFLPNYFEFLDKAVNRRRVMAYCTAIPATVVGMWLNVFIYKRVSNDALVTWFDYLMIIPFSCLMVPIFLASIWPWVDSIFRIVSSPMISFQRASSSLLDHISIQDAVIQELYLRKATHPKDKTFGLYSVFERLGLDFDAPDYTRSLAQVYQELFSKLPSWTNSLDMITYGGRETPGLPSWLPDWKADPNRSWRSPTDRLRKKVEPRRAAGSSMPCWRWQGTERLVLRGIVVSEVLECSGRFQFDLLGLQTNESARRTFRHDLTMVRHFSQFGEPGDLQWPFKERLRGEVTEKVVDWYFGNVSSTLILAMMYDMRQKDRVLFRTAIPTRMTAGNCPAQSRIGDLVALVCGVSVPLVLRPEGECYTLVGPAEVDGLMKGEVWEGTREEDLRDIILI